jgi:hypothetical protein
MTGGFRACGKAASVARRAIDAAFPQFETTTIAPRSRAVEWMRKRVPGTTDGISVRARMRLSSHARNAASVDSEARTKGADVTAHVLERSTRSLRRPAIPWRPAPRRYAPTTREHALVEARSREIRHRRSLAHAVRRAELTYAVAARQLDEFDLYLEGVHRRLRAEGYLSAGRPPGQALHARLRP